MALMAAIPSRGHFVRGDRSYMLRLAVAMTRMVLAVPVLRLR